MLEVTILFPDSICLWESKKKKQKKEHTLSCFSLSYFSNAIYQETELVFSENIAVSIGPKKYWLRQSTDKWIYRKIFVSLYLHNNKIKFKFL